MTTGARRPVWIGVVAVVLAGCLAVLGRPGTISGPEPLPGNLAILSVLTPPADGGCLTRDHAMSLITASGAVWTATPPVFCTSRPEIADWITAEDMTVLRHHAFGAQGCLAAWEEVLCP